MILHIRTKWLLVIIGSTRYVEGVTRLQKYGIIIQNKFPKIGFYDDWISNKYGMFSAGLEKDLNLLRQNNYVHINYIINKSNKKIPRISISNKGRDAIQDIVEKFPSQTSGICGISQVYFNKSLKELIADAYTLYPQYTEKSTIKPEINQVMIKTNSFLNPEFEILFDEPEELKSDMSNLITRQTVEYQYNDEDVREKLAKSAGLNRIPEIDARSFDRLSGILGDKLGPGDIDSVELVRSIRGSD